MKISVTRLEMIRNYSNFQTKCICNYFYWVLPLFSYVNVSFSPPAYLFAIKFIRRRHLHHLHPFSKLSQFVSAYQIGGGLGKSLLSPHHPDKPCPFWPYWKTSLLTQRNQKDMHHYWKVHQYLIFHALFLYYSTQSILN